MSNSIYHIAICDDDPIFLENIEQLTKSILSEKNLPCGVTCFHDSIHFLDEVIRNPKNYQLILLDILMRNLDGIKTAERIRQEKLDIPIVFISSTADFALQGYEVQAHRYLIKPIKKEKLQDAILSSLRLKNEEKMILLKSGTTYKKVAFSDIPYLEIKGHVLKVYLQNSSVIPVSIKMSEAESRFPQNYFYRCHQSYMVNLAFIENISRYQITLIDGTTIPVSKSRYIETRQRLLDFLSI